MEGDPNKTPDALGSSMSWKSDALALQSIRDVATNRNFSRNASLGNTSSLHRGSSGEMIGGDSWPGPLSRRSSRGSWRKGSMSLSRDMGNRILASISLSRDLADHILGEVDSSMVAQVGDSGDRVMADYREDENGALGLPIDEERNIEKGVMRLSDDALVLSNGFRSRSRVVNSSSPVSPLAEQVISPLATDAILHSTEKDQEHNIIFSSLKDEQYKLPRWLDYLSYLIHLAVFGIVGVFTRHLLQKLFGPNLLALTGDNTPLYLDLPSNMLGSFLMGWFGIVFKADIRFISEHLAIGLSTGYLGSLTTFSGWNQKMLDLASKGHWTFAIAGIVLGMFIVNESVKVGVESAEGLRSILDRLNQTSGRARWSLEHWRVDCYKRHLVVMAILLFIWVSLWVVSGALARTKLDDVTEGAVLWLGCLVGPPGVWTRWYLARFNGQGLGRKGMLKWLPIGTLLANIIAASIMATLATISKAVNTKKCAVVVSGVQFGFLGCLSTVSTFVAEVYAMRESGHSGRALAYAVATIVPSFAVGTLIYSVPVWVKNYK